MGPTQIAVATDVASRLRLKPVPDRATERETSGRHGRGFSLEIEAHHRQPADAWHAGVATGVASRLRLKHAAILLAVRPVGVATGVASRLRLKLLECYPDNVRQIKSPRAWLLA